MEEYVWFENLSKNENENKSTEQEMRKIKVNLILPRYSYEYLVWFDNTRKERKGIIEQLDIDGNFTFYSSGEELENQTLNIDNVAKETLETLEILVNPDEGDHIAEKMNKDWEDVLYFDNLPNERVIRDFVDEARKG